MQADMLEVFTCPICLEFAEEAVSTNCCQQVYCKKCLVSLPPPGRCPSCRSNNNKVSFSPAVAVQRALEYLPAKCQECGISVKREFLKDHISHSCPKRRLKCPCPTCLAPPMPADTFAEHIAIMHTAQLIANAARLFYDSPPSSPVRPSPSSSLSPSPSTSYQSTTTYISSPVRAPPPSPPSLSTISLTSLSSAIDSVASSSSPSTPSSTSSTPSTSTSSPSNSTPATTPINTSGKTGTTLLNEHIQKKFKKSITDFPAPYSVQDSVTGQWTYTYKFRGKDGVEKTYSGKAQKKIDAQHLAAEQALLHKSEWTH